MKTISKIITSCNPKSICWNPSAGEDIQIIDTYLNQAAKINAIQPDFFIFSDYHYFIGKNGSFGTFWQSNFEDTLKGIGYEFIEFVDDISQLNISNLYVLDNYKEFKDYYDIPPIDSKDDPYEELGIADLISREDMELLLDEEQEEQEEQEKQHVCNQVVEKLSNIGVVYKRNNIHILFLACDNKELYNALRNNVNVDTLIINRPMDNTLSDYNLSDLKVCEICAGLSYRTHNNLEAITGDFKWKPDNTTDRDMGNINRVIY